nr:hypothetical protein BaRGS_009167 [Batillaria attramentaria]
MSLELEPKTQDRDQTLNIICLWENGNPPVTARLLDRHGVEMEDSIDSSGQIRYRFPAVGCQDAGLIRCEAPGASHNKTVTLLVRLMMANNRGDGAVMAQNIVLREAVPNGNAYEEIPEVWGPRAEAAHQQGAAAPAQAAQEPSAEDDVYVPIDDILARKRQAQ